MRQPAVFRRTAALAERYWVMAEEMATLAQESLPLQATAAEKVWQQDEG